MTGPLGRVTLRRRHVLTAAAIVMLALSAVTPGLAAAGTPAARPSPTAPVTDSPASILKPDRVPVALAAVGSARFADIYGGIAFEDDESRLAVYLTNLDPVAEQAFQDASDGVPVVFRKTANSEQAVNQVHERLQNDYRSLWAAGIEMIDFGPSGTTGLEDIGVKDVTEAQATTLRERYGSALINVYNISAAEAAAITPQDRGNDFSPWLGGDSVWGQTYGASVGYIGGCTTGYGLKFASGGKRLMTAGHCFEPGYTAYNDPPFTVTTTNLVGTVGADGLGATPTPFDTEVIVAAPDKDYIFRGALGAEYPAQVADTITNTIGETVCSDGAYGGEICGFHITHLAHCVTLPHAWYSCGIAEARRTSGAAFTADGDSGGPWFHLSGSTVYAAGTHSALDPTSQTEYFADAKHVLAGFWNNATLCTLATPC